MRWVTLSRGDFHPRYTKRLVAHYGSPQTPYERLMESQYLTAEQKAALSERKRGLNPFELKGGLEKKLSDFFKLLNEYNGKGGDHDASNHTHLNA